jgi:hypothetical protein
MSDDMDDNGQVLIKDIEDGRFIGGTMTSEEAAARGRKGAEARNRMNEEEERAKAVAIALEIGYASWEETPPSIQELATRATGKGSQAVNAMRLLLAQSRKLVSERTRHDEPSSVWDGRERRRWNIPPELARELLVEMRRLGWDHKGE